MNLRTLRRSEERFMQRYNPAVVHTDTKDRPEVGPYGSTGRPKGEGRHASGKDLLLARRAGISLVPALRPLGRQAAPSRPGLFGRAAQAVARTARRVAGAFRGR